MKKERVTISNNAFWLNSCMMSLAKMKMPAFLLFEMLAFCRGKILLCNVSSKDNRKIIIPCNDTLPNTFRKQILPSCNDTPPNTFRKKFFLVIMIHLQNTFLLGLYIIGINHVAT
jgi:hypothetical protein